MVGDKLAEARLYPPYKLLGKQDKTDLASQSLINVTEHARVSTQQMIRRKFGDSLYGQPTEKSQRVVGWVKTSFSELVTHHRSIDF